jgi:hypothetical protein
MFLNIITPCSRPENLLTVSDSININIPRENYRWIVVFDSDCFPNFDLIPKNCECYMIKDLNSISGNAQRNYALSLVDSGHVYFNDDDTTIHEDLWENIKELENDFISFSQSNQNGSFRLMGDFIEVFNIDSHNFIVSKDIIGYSKFSIREYVADGIFAKECYSRCRNPLFINKVLSIYNCLR